MRFAVPLVVFFSVFIVGVIAVTSDGELKDIPVASQCRETRISNNGEEELEFGESLPTGTVIIRESGKKSGWRQSGTIPLPFHDAVAHITASMAERGKKLVRSQTMGDEDKGALIEFAADGGDSVLWMFWTAGTSLTGFSWGVSR